MIFDRSTNSLTSLAVGNIVKSYNTGVLDSYKKVLNKNGVDGAMRTIENVSSAFNPTKDLMKAVSRQTGNNQSRKSSFDGFLFAIYSFR